MTKKSSKRRKKFLEQRVCTDESGHTWTLHWQGQFQYCQTCGVRYNPSIRSSYEFQRAEQFEKESK